ncbi:MAG: transporter substrate-binding domain-containing protein [Clostridia bacterium]|nr:transporter substrate-binding domain-containing protein [Clostridia bacterium]
MKKNVVKAVCGILAATCVVSLAACGSKDELKVGKEFVAAPSQLDALTKLDKGEADVAVIDSVMAGYYTTTGDYADKMQMVDGLVFAEESYGVAGKKGNKALMSKINEALIGIRTTDYAALATEYGLTSSIALTETTADTYADATDSSWTDVVTSGKIVIGYTLFAPIAYEEEGALTGFDIELARKTIAYLNTKYETNVTVEFLLIEWSTKEAKLADGTIDLVWNGMTITPEREAEMCVSVPYLYNKQVAVVLKKDSAKYSTVESMSKAIMTAESGSAGETVIVGEKDE